MKDINKYLEILIEYAKRKLKEELRIEKLEYDNFELVNSYLIYQSIKDKKKKFNILILLPNKEIKSKFYIPAIFTLALHDFIYNYLDDTTVFEVGDIVQKDGQRFQIEKIANGEIKLIKKDKCNTINTLHKPCDIRKYILTTADLNNGKVKLKFNTYKVFFKNILNINENELPSKFKYKSVVITDKNIVDELKKYEINNEKIHKAFPFQYITKTGRKSDNIPIDPMIYIVNDYQTARKYILEKDIKICNITFIGGNKYSDYYLDISEDLNNKRIENCLLIGSADIEENAIPNLLKWKWTLPELNYFNYFETYQINKILVKNDELSHYLEEFHNFIDQIEKEYELNLKELYKFARNILPIVIPSPESRLIKQIDNILLYFGKEGQDIVETAFYDIDECDYEEIWEDILKKFTELINCKKCNYLKYQKIERFKRIDYLVVPKEYIGIWKEENNQYKIRNVISFKDFKFLEVTNKTIVFLGFFGYDHLKSMLYNPNKIHILLYKQEKEHYKNCFNRFTKETYYELKRSDRKTISEISFKETEKVEDISELIKRLFEKNEEDKINPDYSASYSTNILYELTFENDSDILELDENKTVLLKINEEERDEKVKNLKIGDKIRIYDNSTKDELYKIALNADDAGKFDKIEKYSQLWKTELLKFSKNFESLEQLLKHLNDKGLSISNELTIKNWINIDSNVKFPQKKKDLLVLKKSINSELFNEYFNEIVKSRRIFNGIMIALGRDLSDEITDYIKVSKKGQMLKQFSDNQIKQFVDKNSKKRIIKTIKAIDHE
jgi:hypothetical protein